MTNIRSLVASAILVLATTPAFAFNVTGTVTDPLAAPVAGVEIRLYDSVGNPIGIPLTLTDAAGGYVIAGLPSGSYVLQFRPLAATRLLAEETPVVIASADLIHDVALSQGVLLSGYVRDEAGVGIPSIDLQAYDGGTGDLALTPGDDTDATGYYDVVLPAGEYDLEWRSVAAGGLPWIPVQLQAQISVDTVIDVTMQVGLIVTGTVSDELGQPVAGVNLDFIDLVTGIKLDTAGDNTDLLGAFTVQLPVGDYEVVGKPLVSDRLVAGHIPSLTVVADTTVADMVLAPGWVLSGQVVDSSGIPVPEVDIDVSDSVTGDGIITPFDVTDLLGQYQIVVPAGLFDVSFTPQQGSGLAPGVVAAFDVPFDRVLNTVLVAGVVLSGTVTDGTGAPVSGVDIDMKYALTGLDVPLTGDSTDAAGFYELTIAPGTYTLEIEPAKATGLVAERTTGLGIATSTVHNAVLVAGVHLTGTVGDQLGQPVSDVNVDVRRTSDGFEIFTPGSHTAVDGSYHVVIPAGHYDLIYKPGPAYAVQDSLVLAAESVPVSRTVDVTLQGVVGTGVDDGFPAAALGVATAYPNPFNPATVISFRLEAAAGVRVGIHDLSGRLIAVLVDDVLAAGRHDVPWSGMGVDGRAVPSGVYLYSVESGGRAVGGKLTLLK